MRELEPPDTHYFAASVGWLELGNPAEAKAELNQISPGQRSNPDVLEVEWAICAEEKDWESGVAVAKKLLAAAPERASAWLHHAYAIRRVSQGGVVAAWDVLLSAADKFPDEATIPFNLACYACQMDDLERSREWLQRAFQAGDKRRIKAMALADADLQILWNEIEDM